MKCETCRGRGRLTEFTRLIAQRGPRTKTVHRICPDCRGSGVTKVKK